MTTKSPMKEERTVKLDLKSKQKKSAANTVRDYKTNGSGRAEIIYNNVWSSPRWKNHRASKHVAVTGWLVHSKTNSGLLHIWSRMHEASQHEFNNPSFPGPPVQGSRTVTAGDKPGLNWLMKWNDLKGKCYCNWKVENGSFPKLSLGAFQWLNINGEKRESKKNVVVYGTSELLAELNFTR